MPLLCCFFIRVCYHKCSDSNENSPCKEYTRMPSSENKTQSPESKVLEKAVSRARNWVEASNATGPCDRAKIEELIQKRAKYFTIKEKREVVWCASPEELLEKLESASFQDLYWARKNFWQPFMSSLDREVPSQIGAFVHEANLNEFFQNLNARIRTELQKRKGDLSNNLAKTQDLLKQNLRNLDRRHHLNEWRAEELIQFWQEALCPASGAYYDCLWACLPDKTRVKNYFEFLGEAYESGLAFYLPAKHADFLIVNPNRFFANASETARTEMRPRAPWREEPEKKPSPEAQNAVPVVQRLDLLLTSLEMFEARLKNISLPEDISKEAEAIGEKAERILILLKKEKSPSRRFAYEMERIVNHWFKQTMNVYIDLSAKTRAEKLSEALELLRMLQEQLDWIEETIESGKVLDWDVIAETIRQTFKPDPFSL